MTVAIEIGTLAESTVQPALLDLEELLSTRLLVQGNSGSGKSHLLRRLLEQSAPWVQQAVIDPEGDFVGLGERFGHLVVDAAEHAEPALVVAGERMREHRIPVVLNLDGLDAEGQMRRAAAFLGGMFEAPRQHWFPVLVVVDEAQLFAPANAGEVSDEARRASLGAMTNLMCRGRKRGLAGVVATQRLAKLAKNVAAEATNFLMGRTFLDIDMARAADLLGMERRQAESFRDLERGQFMALGPALSRRPLRLRIGAVETQSRSAGPVLLPLAPGTALQEMRELVLTPPPDAARPSRRRPIFWRSSARMARRAVPACGKTRARPDTGKRSVRQITGDGSMRCCARCWPMRMPASGRCLYSTRTSWCGPGSTGWGGTRWTFRGSAVRWRPRGPGRWRTVRPGRKPRTWRPCCPRTCRGCSCWWPGRRRRGCLVRRTRRSHGPTAPIRPAAPGDSCTTSRSGTCWCCARTAPGGASRR